VITHLCSFTMTAPPVSVADAVARAEKVAASVAGPMAERTDSGVWPAEALRALQAAGLAGIAVPRPLGGAGLGLRGVAAVCEVLGRVCASTALCFGMHCVAAAVIAARPTDRQRADFLDAIVAGSTSPPWRCRSPARVLSSGCRRLA
jgi:isovaleryl-CoA dehydrogenase